ncbi:hypothetical protein PtA15_3A275 [Puccinia triticina]|uniref:Uncharacterized protein n=1 Tax=Puccinia triticina TaxID=208348 RepID=A0ABY7CGE6_9BASI|nr:uncharacterized protein PtA15_3A275 [Puccinia triticina]WAQ82910.1 hypothetical protein PtA15_3A275 [Puccinia triticina]
MRTVYDTDARVCPIGAPSRDFSRHRKPPQKAAPQRRATPSSSRANRPQGMVFSAGELPQELQKIGGSELPPAPDSLPPPIRARIARGMGVIFNVNELPQELKDLAQGSNTKPA